MAFRNLMDVVRYVNGDWHAENDLIDKFLDESEQKRQTISSYCSDPELVQEYGNDVYALGMLCGVRFGRKEVLRLIKEREALNS